MILQALTHYYEDLLNRGAIARPGWNLSKISYGLLLDEDGKLVQLLHLQQEVPRGKKTVLAPQEYSLPSPVKRSSGVAANFLWDNSGYLLGADNKGKPERSVKCFEAAKELHLNLLKNADSPAARAIVRFFETWDPSQAVDCPILQEDWEDLMKGGNLSFWYQDHPAAEDPVIREVWQRHYDGGEDAGEQDVRCLVTGRRGPLAQLHPSIKGVVGAQSSGASLVSFNASAFCSYEHEQGANAPTSEYAAFAYATALNTLLADRDHVCRVGDTIIVLWAEGGDTAYQDCALFTLFGGMGTEAPSYQENDLLNALKQLASGHAIDWDESRLDPNTRFYVLGLAPNAARLSVRFFWQNSFGQLAQNLDAHYNRLRIIRPAYDQTSSFTIWRMVLETVRKAPAGAKRPDPSPRLVGDLLMAVLNNAPYPATLLDGVQLRIRAQQDISWGQAAIIKAYYLRNSNNEQLKEVMTMELNEQSTYLPYVLGRLFSVLEAVQQRANPGINTTIKNRYFNSASATPALVFPTLINLAQKHLNKLDGGIATYYDKRITELSSCITETLPSRMTLSEQSAFQIGYYHETQKRYTKKEEK